MKKIISSLLMVLCFLTAGWSLISSADQSAFNQAKAFVDEKYQNQIFSIYGKGTPKEIQSWYFHFSDPESPSKAKLITIKNGKVDQVRPAEGKYQSEMSFDPTKCKVTVETALKTAAEYAEKNQVTYDATAVHLRRPEQGKAPSWRVQLVRDGKSQGYVYTKPEDGSFAEYKVKAADSGGSEDSKNFGKEVEDTFLGIGGDLEEFFTGERTVDK
jgi:hypothetical protein